MFSHHILYVGSTSLPPQDPCTVSLVSWHLQPWGRASKHGVYELSGIKCLTKYLVISKIIWDMNRHYFLYCDWRILKLEFKRLTPRSFHGLYQHPITYEVNLTGLLIFLILFPFSLRARGWVAYLRRVPCRTLVLQIYQNE